MKKMIKVRLLVDTGRNKAGDVRELNPERAEAWIKAGWAEYTERSRTRMKSENLTEEKENGSDNGTET